MSVPEKKPDGKYVYRDYLSWQDNERWEIIDGVPYAMTPAPSWQHQAVLGEIHRQFANYFEGKQCRAFAAPFDVRIPGEDESGEDIATVVQPDLVVVCDKNKLSGTGCEGAPDLVIEILSPSTAKMDLKQKLHLYERSGVKYYWVVDLQNRYITIYVLGESNTYKIKDTYFEGDTIEPEEFEGFEMDVESVFDFE
ncbi:MAG: Uma2 family endonuclease [Firmicutes bacterium]|nr:Uma2 family endonuclease [Bacillota bacterium]